MEFFFHRSLCDWGGFSGIKKSQIGFQLIEMLNFDVHWCYWPVVLTDSHIISFQKNFSFFICGKIWWILSGEIKRPFEIFGEVCVCVYVCVHTWAHICIFKS